MLREIVGSAEMWNASTSKQDEARALGLVEAGLVVRGDDGYRATSAGEQVASAVARTCRDDLWPSTGIVQVDVNALGW
ncbi:hypothetical protein [Planctomyces sp. SH-PL14]|uniref:hypothetical protein n=1 Tax=Planctomyces sp. SH-PL14 TaxID=1632864 RepID=UPI0012E8448F|nr:hypothetical protein [Planctomyces sp. SH-PL14]